MSELFKWGFVLAIVLTWLAVGVGVLMLLLPRQRRTRQPRAAIERGKAA